MVFLRLITALRSMRTIFPLPWMQTGLLPLMLLLLFTGCTPSPAATETEPGILSIQSGTYFGMCVGYCQQEIEITPETVVFRKSSNRADDSKYPIVVFEERMDAETWNALVRDADLDEFRRLPERIGCPDCADGGGEWVQIETAEEIRRVEFEYGARVDGLQELLERLRGIREEYAEKVGE
jgi:hypothetical protein